MGERTRAAITEAIEDHGPITFAEYMDLALYGPGGFYERPPVGPSGDFVTSPHVHPVFAELLARAIRDLWQRLDEPEPFRLVEVGAGDGTLAASLVRHLGDLPLAYTGVEISPGARSALAAIDGLTVTDELTGTADLVLAHELLDNLPFRIVRGRREIRVGVASGRFVEVEAPLDDELTAFLAFMGAGEARDGEGNDADAADGEADVEHLVPVGALSFVDRLAEVAARGYALLIDYGGLGGTSGGVHGYQGHRVVEDVLAHPGDSDVTAGVAFGLVAARATSRGLRPLGTVGQRDALLGLGFERWLREELMRQQAQLDARDGLEAVRTWSGRSRATLLADPAGLGRLRWLLLGGTGLTAPSWIAEPDAAPQA